MVDLQRLQLMPFDHLVEFIAPVLMLQSEGVTPEEFAWFENIFMLANNVL